ncbi:MAG TPA: hypothetical protein DEQ43_09285 [Nocardioides bacterium]|nr:hypothetical protein [Nocardioides sp.]
MWRNEWTVSVSIEDFRQTVRTVNTYAIAWPETRVEVVSRLSLDADAETYQVTIDVTATQDGGVVARPQWRETIPRDLA